MATGFQILYSGRDSAVELPDMDKLLKSQEGLNDMLIAGEERKLSKALADEQYFLEMMKTDPVAAISTANRERQSKAVEKFSTEWGAKMAQRQGELSTSDKLLLQRDKDALKSFQANIKANEERYAQDKVSIEKDNGRYYDKQAFDKAQADFLKTGEYPQSALRVKPINPDLYASSATYRGTPNEISETVVGADKKQTTVKARYNMTEEEASRISAAELLDKEPLLQGYINKFEQLPVTEQVAILDLNGNNAIDPEERKFVQSAADINNPIFKWAAADYAKMIRRKEETSTTKPVSATSSAAASTYKSTAPVTATNNDNSSYTPQGAVTHGKVTFNNNVSIGGVASGTIRIVSAIDTKTGEKIALNRSLPVKVIAYDPATDQALITADRGGALKQELVVTGDEVNSLLVAKGIHRQSLKGFNQPSAATTTKEVIKW